MKLRFLKLPLIKKQCMMTSVDKIVPEFPFGIIMITRGDFFEERSTFDQCSAGHHSQLIVTGNDSISRPDFAFRR